MAEHCLHQVIRFATQLEKKIVPPELKAIREAQMAFNWAVRLGASPHNTE